MRPGDAEPARDGVRGRQGQRDRSGPPGGEVEHVVPAPRRRLLRHQVVADSSHLAGRVGREAPLVPGVRVGVVAWADRAGAELRERLPVEQLVQRRQAPGLRGPAAERVVDHDEVVVAGDLLERLVPERRERAGLPLHRCSAEEPPTLGAGPHRRHAAAVIPAQRVKQTFAFHLAASLCDGRGDRQAAAMIYDQIVIQRIDVRAIGPDVERYSWASDLDQQYGTLTIVRAFDDQGRDGVGATPSYSTGRFDLSDSRDPAPPRPARRRRRAPPARGRLVRPSGFRAPALAGRPVRARHRALGHRSAARRRPAAPAARRRPDAASGLCVDAALGKRRRVRGVCWRPARGGFRAVKFHAWCEADRDSGDAPQGSRRPWRIGDGDDARRRAALRPPLCAASRTRARRDGLRWLEAPLPTTISRDTPTFAAASACRSSPGGTTSSTSGPWGTRCCAPWDALRFDVTVAGGFTPAANWSRWPRVPDSGPSFRAGDTR